MSATVAFVGLGNIGGRVVAHLVKAGHDVAVFDLNAAAVQAAVEAGARSVASAAQAAEGAEAVFLSLPTPVIVESVVGEILPHAEKGAVIVDHSTIDPDTSRRLAATAATEGVGFLDAPVSGGVQGAEAGTLAIMVGGDEAALEKVRPLLQTYAGSVVHVGGSGSGQVVKLANNLITAINIAALGEALTTTVRQGVDLDTAVSVLTKSSANSNVLSNYFPRTLFTTERPTGFALDFMHKDLGLFLSSAASGPVPLPLSNAVRDLFSIGRQLGRGGKDFTSVVEFYEDFAGVRLQTKETGK
ncbi:MULTISPECIES: NAD(P)-dependent oxidoreductase [unclassified Streptomyces]|uniref:NAD(P)-dependent oxidoreductase n=1 Tax=unclassified Streptomyces TaxID=2593676 RepID=UPI002366709B|nr:MULTISPECIES: NAD(P)-dependent oxidoreductase [unclassified Streptomyces]MDF3141708.1 NAD(P)-dependent oxidoreductase [Streptomyces sp. T21Q-yed]WDF38896.1 NAD(P)-dependent oxidoreductase [Streptomyces sp. T12]